MEANLPLWEPSKERIDRANLSRFIKFVAEREPFIAGYADLYDFSIRQPEQFWTAVWDFCGIRASGERKPALTDPLRMPGATWFPNVRLNFAQNLLRFKDDRLAIVARDETGRKQELSYNALHEQVSLLQQGLQALGVASGDRVAAYMPNIPETAVAMLATTSLGAVWSSCSPDFGVDGVVDRFGQIAPKVLIACAGYSYSGKTFDCLDKIRAILDKVPSIEKAIIVPYPARPASGSDSPKILHWEDLLSGFSAKQVHFEPGPFNHPLYIMYSSGTTGAPKCIVHGAGGTLIQHLKELVLHVDLKREDHFFYYTTCGWMMWNWMISGLAVGATLVLYDGSPSFPDGNALWDLVDETGISVFGTSAKWLSAIEKTGVKPKETHKLLALKTLLSTGSPLAPESFDYAYRDIKERIMLSSISGGTDIVSCFALGNPLLPVYRGELQCRGLGMHVQILDEQGRRAARNQRGELACVAPFPSMPIGFWNDADGEKYRQAYFSRVPGVWCHGDYAELTDHDGLVIFGRSDATLNPGGVRIGTAEIYRQVEQIPEVMESLAIGQDWRKDVRIVLFVRLQNDIALDDALVDKIKRTIREHTTPRHVPAKVIQVRDIPRTRSGKITELAVRDVVHGEPVKNTEALANPEALEQFRNLRELQAE